jgi:hypothetical protein
MHCNIKLALFGKSTLIAMALLAASAPASAVLIHDYELNGSLADALGGPSLVAEGGTLGSSSYSFGPNQGLTLSGALSTAAATNGNYSIEMVFRFSDLTSFRKILDFKNLGSDTGFYELSSALNFFQVVTGASTPFAPNVNVDVVLTRDGTTVLISDSLEPAAATDVVGYVNGVQQITFADSSSLAVFDPGIIRFFHDDNNTGGRESSAGVVECIRIFDSALTPAQVAALPSCVAPTASVPEPATLLLLGAGLAGFGFMRKRSN